MGGPWYTTWAFPGALQLQALSFPTAVYNEEEQPSRVAESTPPSTRVNQVLQATSVWAAAAAAWHYLIINWFCVLAV
jgi:hypothetical protein